MRGPLFPRIAFAGFLFVVIFVTIGVVSYIVNENTLKEWLSNPYHPDGFQSSSQNLYSNISCTGPVKIIFLSGLGVSSSEWWAIQKTLSSDYSTISYDRPGYTWNHSDTNVNLDRQIEAVRGFYNECPKSSQIILVGQGLGANILQKILNQNDFSGIKAVVYIDPLINPTKLGSEIEPQWKDKFIDQTKNLERYAFASRLGIFRFISLTPYDVPEAIRSIVLNNLANPITAKTVLNEYNQIVKTTEVSCTDKNPIPIIVIHHNSEQNIELMKNFGAPDATAKSIEDIWTINSKSYLCGRNSKFITAKKSVFDIHIQEPEIIVEAVRSFAK